MCIGAFGMPLEALNDYLLDVHLAYNCKSRGYIRAGDCDAIRGDPEQVLFIVASYRVVS